MLPGDHGVETLDLAGMIRSNEDLWQYRVASMEQTRYPDTGSLSTAP
jgi:hypothetical protein